MISCRGPHPTADPSRLQAHGNTSGDRVMFRGHFAVLVAIVACFVVTFGSSRAAGSALGLDERNNGDRVMDRSLSAEESGGSARRKRKKKRKRSKTVDSSPSSNTSNTSAPTAIAVPPTASGEGHYDFAFSLRFIEATAEAGQLKRALELEGFRVYMQRPNIATDKSEEMIDAYAMSDVVVIFGTWTYGLKGKSFFSTREQIKFIKDDHLPFFLIKMCSRFSIPYTRFQLPGTIMFFPWAFGTPMPDQLIPHLKKRLEEVRGSKSIGESQPEQFSTSSGDTFSVESESNGTPLLFAAEDGLYEGEKTNGEANGFGKWTGPSGVLVGMWANNVPHGFGKFMFRDGDSYTGHYENGQRQGDGTFVWTDMSKFIGSWKGGAMDGQGIMYGSDGSVTKRGTWRGGEFQA